MDKRELVDGPIGHRRPMHMIFPQTCCFGAGVALATQDRHTAAVNPVGCWTLSFQRGAKNLNSNRFREIGLETRSARPKTVEFHPPPELAAV
jgi:hypothetical protein